MMDTVHCVVVGTVVVATACDARCLVSALKTRVRNGTRDCFRTDDADNTDYTQTQALEGGKAVKVASGLRHMLLEKSSDKL